MPDNIFDFKTINRYGVNMRLVEPDDAAFILSLRTDEKLGRFLSPTHHDVGRQTAWLEEYKERESRGQEYYFIAVGENGERYGTTRLYDFEEEKFTTGSWLFSRNTPLGVAIKADIIGREIAFENLGFEVCKFDVRKDNKSVIKYHKAFKPTIVGEDDDIIYFELDKPSFYNYRNKLLKIK